MCLALNVYSQGADTFEVRFALRDPRLNNDATGYIDSLVKKNKVAPGQKISLMGYADYLGTPGYNDTLSAARAANVQDYLRSKGMTRTDIIQCIGKGKIERPGLTSKEGNAPDRKVLIIANRLVTNIDIRKLNVDEAVAMQNILFYPSSPEILPSSLPELENLFAFLLQNKTVTIQIEGHICCIPRILYTDEISEARAEAVYDYLVSNGISAERMKHIGLGTSQPSVYPELTENDRIRNRRVVVRILSK